MFHAESIQNFLIDLEVNDIVITPNLNRIAKEGIYFSSFYPQSLIHSLSIPIIRVISVHTKCIIT